MANVEANVAVAITGAVYRGKSGATAPTGTSGALTSYDELGFISEDGITRAMPGAGDRETIKAWQNGAIVRVISTPSDENPAYTFTLLETKKEVIEAALGVTVTQTSSEGSYVIDSNAPKSRDKYVIHVIDGSELERHFIPLGEVVEIGEQVFANGQPIGYEVTVECHRDASISGQIKVWSTRLKSPAS